MVAQEILIMHDVASFLVVFGALCVMITLYNAR